METSFPPEIPPSSVSPKNLSSAIPVEIPAKKIFREKAIWGGSFLGGPLAAGYIMAYNFKVFGEPVKARDAWIISILFTLFLVWVIFHIPENVKIPNEIIPLIYCGIASALMHHYQSKPIKEYLDNGGVHYSGWRVFAIGIISLLAFLLLVFGFLYFTNPALTADSKKYGASENAIFYDKSELKDAEVDQLAASFQKNSLFVNDHTVSVYVKEKAGTYELSIPVKKDSWNQPATVSAFQQLRDAMQPDFPTHHLVIKLASDKDIEDVKETLR